MRVVAGPRGTKPLVAFFRLQAVRSAEGAAVLSQPRHAARVKLGWAAMGQAGLRHSRLCAAQARWPRGPRITVCRMMCGCPRRRSSQAFLRLVAPSLRPARRGASRPGQSAAHSPSRGFGRVGLPASQQHGTALRGRSPACPLEKAPGTGLRAVCRRAIRLWRRPVLADGPRRRRHLSVWTTMQAASSWCLIDTAVRNFAVPIVKPPLEGKAA